MNKAILMGRLTRDPELRHTANGNAVCQFTLAVDRRFKSANGERQADFINCSAWRQTAEFITNYFKKGMRLSVVGSIQTSSWDDNDGKRQYKTEVVVEEAYFTDSKNTNETSRPSTYRNDNSNYSRGANQSSSQNYEESFVPAPDDTTLPFEL